MTSILTPKTFSIFAVLVALTSVGLYFYQESESTQLAQARDALFQAQKVFEAEVKALSEDKKVPGASLDVDASFPKTIAAFADIAEKSSAKQARFEAAMRNASMYLDYGSFQKALDWADKALKNADGTFQKASAAWISGNAAANLKDWAKAKSAFESVTSNKNTLTADAYVKLIEIQIKEGKAAEAKALLEKLKKLTFATAAISRAEKLVNAN